MSESGLDISYNQYLLLRGYDPSSNKFLMLKRALIDSWAEPGFHRFWRVWNPGIGHLLYRLYLFLGGNRIRIFSTILVFLICGFIHDLIVMAIFRRPFIAFSTAFMLFGIIASINRLLEPVLNQDSWLKICNVLCNVTLLGASIFVAVQLQMAVFP
jgi:hypothetical protein